MNPNAIYHMLLVLHTCNRYKMYTLVLAITSLPSILTVELAADFEAAESAFIFVRKPIGI